MGRTHTRGSRSGEVTHTSVSPFQLPSIVHTLCRPDDGPRHFTVTVFARRNVPVSAMSAFHGAGSQLCRLPRPVDFGCLPLARRGNEIRGRRRTTCVGVSMRADELSELDSGCEASWEPTLFADRSCLIVLLISSCWTD